MMHALFGAHKAPHCRSKKRSLFCDTEYGAQVGTCQGPPDDSDRFGYIFSATSGRLWRLVTFLTGRANVMRCRCYTA
jgi:hypothetical protein